MRPKRSPMSPDRHLSSRPPRSRLLPRPGLVVASADRRVLRDAFAQPAPEPDADGAITLRMTTRLEPVAWPCGTRPAGVRARRRNQRPARPGHRGDRQRRTAPRRRSAARRSPELRRADGPGARERQCACCTTATSSGPEAQITLSSFKGYVLEPTFLIGLTGAGGSAKRVDFLDSDRGGRDRGALFQLPADGGQSRTGCSAPTRSSSTSNRTRGWPENAVLRFLGVPIRPRRR